MLPCLALAVASATTAEEEEKDTSDTTELSVSSGGEVLKDEGRLIFDLGDVTINFIPLILLAKMVILVREFFLCVS